MNDILDLLIARFEADDRCVKTLRKLYALGDEQATVPPCVTVTLGLESNDSSMEEWQGRYRASFRYVVKATNHRQASDAGRNLERTFNEWTTDTDGLNCTSILIGQEWPTKVEGMTGTYSGTLTLMLFIQRVPALVAE